MNETKTHEGRWAKNPEGRWMVAITKFDGQYVSEGDTIIVVKRSGERQTMIANGDFDFPTVESGLPNLFGVRKPATAPAPRDIPEGVHVDNAGRYVLVATSNKGYRFGKVWNGNGFRYERGATAGLSEATVITAEQAATFGHTFHRCVFCCRDLSTAESTAVGYGPSCAKQHGLPWGAKAAAAVTPAEPAEDPEVRLARIENAYVHHYETRGGYPTAEELRDLYGIEPTANQLRSLYGTA